MSHDGRLDGDEEVLLLAAILQNDSVRVVDIALGAAVGAEETGHRRRSTKQRQGLVDCVRAFTQVRTSSLIRYAAIYPLPRPNAIPWPGEYSFPHPWTHDGDGKSK
jgi:hypothetical protein